MKEAYRHAPVTKERPNKLVKRVSRVASPKKDEQKRFNAPIFNGPSQGHTLTIFAHSIPYGHSIRKSRINFLLDKFIGELYFLMIEKTNTVDRRESLYYLPVLIAYERQ